MKKIIMISLTSCFIMVWASMSFASNYNETSTESFSKSGSQVTDHVFSVSSGTEIAGNGTLRIGVRGDFNGNSEYADVYVEGDYIGRHNGGHQCSSSYDYASFTISQSKMNYYASDGQISVEVRNSRGVNYCNSNRDHEVTLNFTMSGNGGNSGNNDKTSWTTGAYSNNSDISQILSISGASSLTVTVTGTTESCCDYILIYDSNHNEVKRLSGDINESFTVTGSSITARLYSDYSVTKSGVTVSIQEANGSVATLPRMSSNVKHVGVHVYAYGKSKSEIQKIARNIKKHALGSESASTYYTGNQNSAVLAVQVEITPANFAKDGLTTSVNKLKDMINTFTEEGFAVHLLISCHDLPYNGWIGVNWSDKKWVQSGEYFTFSPYQPSRERIKTDKSICPYDLIFENFHKPLIEELVKEGLTQKLALIYILNEFDYRDKGNIDDTMHDWESVCEGSDWRLCRAEALAYTAQRGFEIAHSAAQSTVPIGMKFMYFHENSGWNSVGSANQLAHILVDVLGPNNGVIGYDCYWNGNCGSSSPCTSDKNTIISILRNNGYLNEFENGRIEIAEYGRCCGGLPNSIDYGGRTTSYDMEQIVSEWSESSGFNLFAYNATNYPGGCYALADSSTLEVFESAKATLEGLKDQIELIIGRSIK